jgi:hypothetical protein
MILLLLSAPARIDAQGGPPMVVDDPDTPGPGYWEINLAGVFAKTSRERRLEAPLADINYGVGERLQLKFEIPWVSVGPLEEPVSTGSGNALIGMKWRFVGQEGRRIAWSVYPQIELNTGRALARKGLVDEGTRFLLPTQLTVQFGWLEINSEIGRNFARRASGSWVYGLSTEAGLPKGLELVGEWRGEHDDSGWSEAGVDGGGRWKLSDQLVLLAAAGTTVHASEGHRHVRVFLGIRLNLPHQFLFE